MKKQLLEFLSLNHWRLLFLAMILMIAQGAAFSQGIKTVTTNADDGPGSLRQTIKDAVDGDVINFDGAITTITVDSTLNLGDKSLTIDGGGDVIIERYILSLDSFRVVTITGAPDKVVTFQNLTIQNGFAKEDGGGIYANNAAGGLTVIDNCVFTNNTAELAGGALFTEGFTDYGNIVKNCVFTENKALHTTQGRGGAIFPINATITDSKFTNNECGDSGGAIMTGNNVNVFNCEFIGNASLDDDGGAIRLQGSNCSVDNCMFDSNSSGDTGGAMFMAKGEVHNSVFINNTSNNSGGGVNANNDVIIENCLFDGNSTGEVGGGAYIDDNALITNCIAINNSAADNGGGFYLAGKKGHAILFGAVVANNSADTLGGGLYVETAKIINTTIVNNYAADNGGAISGNGDWFLANSIVYGNDAAGTDKNIQFISNTATDHAANSAIDATAYDAAAWMASNITILDASPFVGGSEADSLMLPTGSALIDAGDTTNLSAYVTETDLNGVKRVINGAIDLGVYERYISSVVTTDADDGAGSLRQVIADAVDGESLITFADGITTIKIDQPLELGDKSLIIDGEGDVVLDAAFNGDAALDTVRVMTITGAADKVITVKNLTIQNGFEKHGEGGALYADHSTGGKTILENITFENNSANSAGGAAYISGLSTDYSTITNCVFNGNEAIGNSDGGAMQAEYVEVSGCTFTNNVAGDDGGALYFYEGNVSDSHFSGNFATDAGGAVRVQDVNGSFANCTFDSNSADGSAGAVFMARGSLVGCDFTNNTSGADGGAVFGNQNECVLTDCLFDGNSATNDGGGAFIDDGGTLTNCIIINNTAGNNGGGLYLKGANAPATAVGCLIAENTATVQGGGLYVLSGNMINTIITQNYANTNGGAFTGTTGPWLLANSVVYGNDAAGADKNIEYVSNSAPESAVYSAIDATAYNSGWTAVEVTTLDASPFVGGTGPDSLHSASAALIDKGTLEYGVVDLLPEFDLDGEARIQTAIDLGVYETELISVLGVTLDRGSLTVSVGGTGTLVATVEPDFATDKSIIWSSSDESVATVDATGVVTGVSEGSATITATTVDGGFTATAEVTVNNAVTGVTLNETSLTLEVGETFNLVATVEPADATNQTVYWTSDDTDVATVDNNGLVTAVAVGTAAISVVTEDGSFIATSAVTVTEAGVAVTGVSLDQETLTLEPGGTGTLVATVTPEDATDKSVTWTSSDEAVATVADGVVTAVAEGTATITVETTDGGFTATATVVVETTGTEDFKAGISLYPNPVQNVLFVKGENIHSVSIYSLTGNTVMIVKEGISDGINLSGIESGMYILKIKSDRGTTVTKVMKE